MAPVDLNVEPSPDMIPHGTFGTGRQSGIGMQKNQNVAPRLARACVHLHGPPARREDDTVAEPSGKLARLILAAAVGDDHFVAARTQWRKRFERGADTRRLVQRRDDDRESFRDQS